MTELKNKAESVVDIEVFQIGIKSGSCVSSLILMGITAAHPPSAVVTAPKLLAIGLGAVAVAVD